MVEFKVGDWVTVGNCNYFNPERKYEVFKDRYGDLHIIDDEGVPWCYPLKSPKIYQVEKTTPPETTQTIQSHGRTYVLEPLQPHEWKFGQWARHEVHGVVFVFGWSPEYIFVVSNNTMRKSLPKELTYICDAEIPK